MTVGPDRGAPRLSMIGMTKTFGAATALQAVDLTLHAGEVHGLVGQNGSGKSTLVKILAGYHAPDDGAVIEVDGMPLRTPPRPTDLMDAGVSFVHQDLGLLDDLSVTENVCIGQLRPSPLLRRIDWAERADATSVVLERLGADIDPHAPVGSLDAAERATVAIARGMLIQRPASGVIVLDEATRALPRDELQEMHRLVRSIADGGGAVLLISHNLEEVMALTDRVTVLRDGRVAGGGLRTTDLSESQIARLMLGYELELSSPRPPAAGEVPSIWVKGLRGDHVDGIDLAFCAGEIVGLTGLTGSGFESVPYLLTGAAPAAAGTLTVDGDDIDLSKASTRRTLAAGVVLVPERRERDGLAFDETVADNITLPRMDSKGSRWLIGSRWQAAETAAVLDGLDVRPPDASLLVRQLSGGNQQKVLLGKWLQSKPRLLILHEPTQAVDVGARNDILSTLKNLAGGPTTIVIASIEAGDLAAVCDRIIVFRDGAPDKEIVTRKGDDVIDLIYAGHIERPSP